MTDLLSTDSTSEQDREADGYIRGLAIAEVTDNEDPEGLARVRVRLPWQEDSAASYWARLATPMATGGQRGIYFLPDVGDEVLVGFERGDPSHPCIIGSLWSSPRQPPETNDGENNPRVIRSRGDSELRFDDGPQPWLELSLADGKLLRMDDQMIKLEDGKGNSFTIESTAGSITIESTGELKLKSSMITIEATAAMELKASGTMTIKGALVQIN